jgi:hypothetical protein
VTPLEALSALEQDENIQLLITKARFSRHSPHGISLALMAKTKRRGIKILFVARPEFRENTKDIGAFLPYPVEMSVLVETVTALLEERGGES